MPCRYLSFDAIVWSNAIKFYSLSSETSTKVSKLANRFWLAGILLSIVNGAFKSVRLAREERKLKHTKSWSEKDAGQQAEQETRLSTILAYVLFNPSALSPLTVQQCSR
jgi:peroxin-11B